MSNIDVSKYGFVLSEETDGICTFLAKRGCENIQLTVLDNIYTLQLVTDDRNIMVANRYKLKNQSEFDFLIFNGRLSASFNVIDNCSQVK